MIAKKFPFMYKKKTLHIFPVIKQNAKLKVTKRILTKHNDIQTA